MIKFSISPLRKSIIFIPVYNCESTIIRVLEELPLDAINNSFIMIIDNGSLDKTVDLIKDYINQVDKCICIALISTNMNLGYAGSQKLAYEISCDIENIDWVIMLHGDGQYDPHLVSNFTPFQSSNLNAIYGFRSKTRYKFKEETPFITWASIKCLNVIETFITGVRLKEWHTGFIMYSTKFLKKVNFSELTTTPHLDGQLLALSSRLEGGVKSFPIYKKYENLQAFEGAARMKYIKSVFKLMPQIRKIVNNPDLVLMNQNIKRSYEDKFTTVCFKEIE